MGTVRRDRIESSTAARLAFGLLCGAGAALSTSCSKDPSIQERAIVVYAPRACPISQSEGFSAITASGDFEPDTSRPPVASLYLRDIGAAMTDLPAKARSLLVNVSQRNGEWVGVTDVPESGNVNVLVWPKAETCRLTRDVERRTDMAFGVFGSRFLVAGGKVADGASVPHTFVGDLTTGVIERLELGLRTRRTSPSITPFPLAELGVVGALVAGGADPDGDTPIASAEVFVPTADGAGAGDFEGDRIELSEPRARHGAVVLASGETLLVGGRGPGGPLRSVEIIDPVSRRARTSGVAVLAFPRVEPTVVRLASGEILVAGGVDASGAAVRELEWLVADASTHAKKTILPLVSGRERGIIPLQGGGALAVVLPTVKDVADPARPFVSVYVISAEGSIDPVPDGLPIDQKTIDVIRLFPGTEGRPVLWTGKRWLRWQPWFNAFELIAEAPTVGPASDPATGAAGVSSVASADNGLALWLDRRDDASMMNVTGYRFDAATQYEAVSAPLLVDSTARMAPDRRTGTSLRFDPTAGLSMGPGASAFVADVTFTDFDLELDVTGASPSIILREQNGREFDIGGVQCAFAQSARQHLFVARRQGIVRVRVDEFEERACPSELEPTARVSIGLRGGQGAASSAGRNLRIVRR